MWSKDKVWAAGAARELPGAKHKVQVDLEIAGLVSAFLEETKPPVKRAKLARRPARWKR